MLNYANLINDDYNYYLNLIDCKLKSDIFKLCYEYCFKLFNVDFVRVYFFNDTRDFLICKYKYGSINSISNDDCISIKQIKSIISRTALENTPQIILDTLNDHRIKTNIKEKFDISSLITIPLASMNIVHGVLSFNFKKIIDFEDQKFNKLLLFVKYAFLMYERDIMLEKIIYQEKKFKEEIDKKTLEIEKINEQLILTGKMSALGQLTSQIAHEIKNPLAIIKMLINTINSELDNYNKYKKDILIISSEIERFENILNKFLDFARPKKVEKKIININDLIFKVNELLKIKLKEENIILNLDLYLPAINVLIDPDQIKQVLLNILLNSIEACKKSNPAIINIKTSILNKEKNYLKIDISDNGEGIKEDILNKIFTPFTTNKTDGLGLGLSICYRIISEHNGMIYAKNLLKGGAKIEIILPIDKN